MPFRSIWSLYSHIIGGLSAAQPDNGAYICYQASTQLQPFVLEARSAESKGRWAELSPPIPGRTPQSNVFIAITLIHAHASHLLGAARPGTIDS